MSSISIQTTVARTGHAKVAMFTLRALAVLAVLLLAAAVEVAAQSYFDPQGEIAVLQSLVAP
ncbi:MAG: hypothetical protein ACREB2_06835 [Pseudolabrys sp.]